MNLSLYLFVYFLGQRDAQVEFCHDGLVFRVPEHHCALHIGMDIGWSRCDISA